MASSSINGTPRSPTKNTLYVAPGMYLNQKFLKTVNRDIRKTPLKTRGKYVYSDLPLVITPQIVKNVSGNDFNQFVTENFYNHLEPTH
jgi:CubicO group peptidase (beta-lactamase class C family)